MFSTAIETKLAKAGITINGSNPWDIQVWQIVFTRHGSDRPRPDCRF